MENIYSIYFQIYLCKSKSGRQDESQNIRQRDPKRQTSTISSEADWNTAVIEKSPKSFRWGGEEGGLGIMNQMKLDSQTCPSVFRSTFLSSHSRNGAIKEPSLSAIILHPLLTQSRKRASSAPFPILPSLLCSVCAFLTPQQVLQAQRLKISAFVSRSEWEVASIYNFCCVSEVVVMWCTTVSDPGSAEIRFQLHSPCVSHLLRTEVALRWWDKSKIIPTPIQFFMTSYFFFTALGKCGCWWN